ncbi:hypothetical protein P3S68_018110 [Capsicum galapagoense]
MESELEVVRDKKTGAVLFYTKRCLPFKTAHRLVRASKPKNNAAASVAEVNSSACTKAKNNLVDVVLPSKNVQLMSDFREAAADAGVMLDFGDNYGFWDNLRSLEKEFPNSYLFEKEKSKFWGEVARLRGLGESIEDAKNLSRDVYNLSVMEEMLDDFKKENLN